MKYCVQAIIRFDTEEEARKIFEELKKVLKKRFEKDDAHIILHECYHDEEPTKPCKVIEIIYAS
ncbi:hypothetical protein DRN52_07145 [Thermococci archaeon]|nr:MAG: hypothetical protein DRN52_07145 [Thermococci archaeon]